jgi:hypothetical protein
MLIIILIIAWKYEHMGGALFIITALLFIILTKERGNFLGKLIVVGPPIVIGILFLFNRHKKAKSLNKS